MNTRICTNTSPSLQQSPSEDATVLPKLFERIHSAATGVLGELAVSLLLHTYVIKQYPFCQFTIYASIGVLVSILVGEIIKKIWNFTIQHKENEEDWFSKNSKRFIDFSLINLGNLAFPGLYIHEQFGHGMAARLLYKTPGVKVVIDAFKGGNTEYAISYGLTSVGKFFGKYNSLTIITAAGLGSSLVFATASFALAHFLKRKFPNISRVLNCQAISQITMEVIYGISTLLQRPTNLSNDYIQLWQIRGIHPALPIALLILIPTVINQVLLPPNT